MMIRTADEVVDNTGLDTAKPFWSGISTVPSTTNGYGESLYTGSFAVIDNITNPNYDGYCEIELNQTATVVGVPNAHYRALRETSYLLPIFRSEDTNIYMPLSVAFDWDGDTDSAAYLELFSSDAPTQAYIRLVFRGTGVTTTVNGDQLTGVDISGFYSDTNTTHKLLLQVFSMNITGYVDKGSSIKGRLQVALTDTTTNVTRILYDAIVNPINPFRLYQFEARLVHD